MLPSFRDMLPMTVLTKRLNIKPILMPSWHLCSIHRKGAHAFWQTTCIGLIALLHRKQRYAIAPGDVQQWQDALDAMQRYNMKVEGQEGTVEVFLDRE